MQMKTERFEMRMDRETLKNLDAWRADQSDLPSRAEAVRRLIDAGKGQVRISGGEELILRMLCDLYKHQEVSSRFDPEFITEAINHGYYWALNWKYGLSEGPGAPPRIVSEVYDVLNMWSFIECGYAKLSPTDKERVESEAELFGRNVAFRGFDAKGERDHFGVARFLIKHWMSSMNSSAAILMRITQASILTDGCWLSSNPWRRRS